MSSWIRATRYPVTPTSFLSCRAIPARGNWCTRMRKDGFASMSEYEPGLGTRESEGQLEVSVIMPCLDEHETVGVCVQKAVGALAQSGLTGEVIVADNGSTDGSVEIAESLGARVVGVPARGYGHALRGGLHAPRGPYQLILATDAS